MEFTLVSTVYNEAKRLDQTIKDLIQQTLQPSEIIIVDAGSTDGTFEMLNEWKNNSKVPVVVFQKHKCNVAEGRNIAIRAAKYDIIASMDFGCRFDPKWLESIITPFNDPGIDVVGGGYSVIEGDQETLSAKVDFVLANGYKVDVHKAGFIPSSRSIAYRKSIFNNIGGYCEWLTLAGDDTVFGMQIKAKGYKTINVQDPFVYWGRHKKTKSFVKEMFRYGLGNGEAHVDAAGFRLFLTQMLKRTIFIISFLFLIIASFTIDRKILLFMPIVIMVLTVSAFRPYKSYLSKWLRFRSTKYDFSVLLYGFYFYEVTRLGYLKGYIHGRYYSTPDKQKAASLLNLS